MKLKKKDHEQEVETKTVKVKSAKITEPAKAGGTSMHNNKQKKFVNTVKENNKKNKESNVYLTKITAFDEYLKLSDNGKRQWLKKHNISFHTTGIYNHTNNKIYINQINPFTESAIVIPCGDKHISHKSETVELMLTPNHLPEKASRIFDYAVLGIHNGKSAGNSQYIYDEVIKHLNWEQLDKIDDYKKIHFDDFVTMSDHNPCVKHKHDIEPINALVFVLRKSGTVTTKTIPASYCRTCSKYYISKWQYEDICEHGVPLFRKTVEKKGTQQYTNGFFNNLNAESKLHSNGYNVSSSEDLSDAQRQIILSLLMESGVCEREEIKSHLSWLISSREGQDSMQNAVAKWKKDRKFVASYKMGDCRLVGIKLLRYKG